MSNNEKSPPTDAPEAPAPQLVDRSTIEGTAEFALKWNISGHRVIAALAIDLLRDEEHPAVEAIDAIQSADPDTDRADSFDNYAAWPDEQKKDPVFKKKTGAWHYIDIPFDGETDGDAELPDGPHVLSAMTEQMEILTTSGDPRARADALAFIVHFVGDIHQPLHCTELQNDEFPEGDGGGNKFKLAHGSNMHSMWDGFVASNKANILTSAGKLKSLFPAEDFAEELKVTDFKDWILESHAIGRDAYRRILDEDPELRATDEYREWGRTTARSRSALAAYRLADLLKRALT